VVQINFAAREVNCKIVYYGPGLSGKTTNLEMIHTKIPASHRGELTSIATEGDRTLFFDFMPLDLGKIGGMTTRFQLYTVPGQVYYNATRKLVLQGVDGIIFVADSQQGKLQENIDSLRNLEENLAEYGLDLTAIPHVFQYNKRDLPNIIPVEELNSVLNKFNAPYFEAVAITGEGVFPTLKKCAELVLANLQRQYGERMAAPAERVPVVTAASKSKPAAPAAPPKPAPPSQPAKPAPPPPPPPSKPAPPPPPPKVEAPRPVTPPKPPAPKPPVRKPQPVAAQVRPKPTPPKPPEIKPVAQKPPSAPPIVKRQPPPAKVEAPAPPRPEKKKGVSPVLLVVMLIIGIVLGLLIERFGKVLGRVIKEKPPASENK